MGQRMHFRELVAAKPRKLPGKHRETTRNSTPAFHWRSIVTCSRMIGPQRSR